MGENEYLEAKKAVAAAESNIGLRDKAIRDKASDVIESVTRLSDVMESVTGEKPGRASTPQSPTFRQNAPLDSNGNDIRSPIHAILKFIAKHGKEYANAYYRRSFGAMKEKVEAQKLEFLYAVAKSIPDTHHARRGQQNVDEKTESLKVLAEACVSADAGVSGADDLIAPVAAIVETVREDISVKVKCIDLTLKSKIK